MSPVENDCTSLGTKIPKEDYLVNGKHIVVDQALISSQIEGNQCTLDDVLDPNAARNKVFLMIGE